MRCSHLDRHRRPLLFVLVVLPLRCCFECLHSLRVPTLGKSSFSPHEGSWCRRSTALSSSWVSNLGESTVKETNPSFDRSRSEFVDPRYRPRGRITKSVTVTTAYNRTIFSGTAASAQYKMAKAALYLNPIPTRGGGHIVPPPPPQVHFLKYLRNALSYGLETFWQFKWIKLKNKNLFFNRLRPPLVTIATFKVDACFWKAHFGSFHAKAYQNSMFFATPMQNGRTVVCCENLG